MRIDQNTEESPHGVDEEIRPVRIPSGHEALVDFVREAESEDYREGQEEGSKGDSSSHARGDHPRGEKAQGKELDEVEKNIRHSNGWLCGKGEGRGMEDGPHQEHGGKEPIGPFPVEGGWALSNGQEKQNDGADDEVEWESDIG